MNSKLNTGHTTDHWFNPKALLAKPRARGWIHLIATPLVLMAAMFAITVPETFTQRLSVAVFGVRSEEHTSELQSRGHLVCRLLLEKKKTISNRAKRDETPT